MTGPFQRLAIVNRGEPAMRLVRAVREWNAEGRPPIATIALFTDPDRDATFVREADEAVALGPALADLGGRRVSAYVDAARLVDVLRAAGAEAAWVGWGFVAEDAEFAERCERAGIVFVGPDPAAMRAVGNKIAAKRLAEQAGLVVAPWSGGPVTSDADALEHGARLGYPLAVKAAAGGGGRGIRVVHQATELPAALASARAEAGAAFGDATVFLERWMPGSRHVEVQILGDAHGTTWALGVRDCSIQRRHQKVLEESPSPVLTAAEDAALCAGASRLARLVGYRNAGTVEFLFDPERRMATFMEVNARLQVEHPVTEATTGVDLVKLQLHVAQGGRLAPEPPLRRGHAIEVRLNAEDPDRHFAPAPGRIALLRLPLGAGVRVDTGVAEGDVVPPDFDSMIAKLIAYGTSRIEALARLRRALADTTVVLAGGTTNKAFLAGLLARPEVESGTADTGWLDRLAADGAHVSHAHADVALVAAAVEAYDAEAAVERTQFFSGAARGRPRVRADVGRLVELRHRGQVYRLDVRRLGPASYRVVADGARLTVRTEPAGPFARRVAVDGVRHRVVSVLQALDYLVEVDGVPHRISRDAGGVVRAPTPAMVVGIAVAPGDEVPTGARLAVLEAMKMELTVTAPFAGRVREVRVAANTQVDAGAALVVLEPLAAAEASAPAGRLVFGATAATPPGWAEAGAELQRLVLGYDVERGEARSAIARFGAESRAQAPDTPALLAMEDDILAAFADVQALFGRHRATDEIQSPGARTPHEHLLAYLRSPDAAGDGLPPWFVDRLLRALARYDVSTLARGPTRDEALVHLWKSAERVEEQLPAVLAILDRRLAAPATLRARARDEDRALLERLIALGRGRFPALYDLARELRYRSFDQPLFERARDAVYASVDAALARLRADPPPAERAALMASLVDCPQPLVATFAQRFGDAAAAEQALPLEILTRRYYRIRRLEAVEVHRVHGRACVTAEYDHESRRVHVVTSFARLASLDETLSALAPVLAAPPPDHDVVLDVYAVCDDALGPADATARLVQSALARVPPPRRLRRVVLAVGGRAGRGMGAMQHFTYRPGDDGYAEERVYRDLHPMMAKRLHVARLANFDVERLPSAEDVYLFRGVARTNRRDERLFAIAEVRDLTAVRDAAGRVVALPHLERMLAEALAGIRVTQARRADAERLQWNRVMLYVWPPAPFGVDELDVVVRRLAPETEGLGLEQVVVRAAMTDPATGVVADRTIRFTNPQGRITTTVGAPTDEPLRPLGPYEQKVVQCRRRGLVYPYELLRTIAAPGGNGAFPPGEFVEHDLDADGRLVPVSRPPGQNAAHLVVGVARTFTSRYPDGMRRVVLLGDPSQEMGSLAEAECRRIIAALDLAETLDAPVEWFALSAGAKISMESGTENMDWISRVLRRLVLFTQAGGEVNVVVCGINVGAQPYWNAEATMLMHTRGILVMTPDSAMVLTGKQALDYSGSVSAEDNQGIGGYERIMGRNGQAQYLAENVVDAAALLLRYYEHAYRAPGERFPRRACTGDPVDRDVRRSPHGGDAGAFASIGDVFDDAHNPGRKHPFDIRRVMAAVVDQDHPPLERWPDMRDAEVAVVWDAHVGGWPVCLLGFESHPVPRTGFVPADGPPQWTAGTLFPRASKKIARALNAASGNRPVVVLANLSGFDGSPESMRELQLEYGAEIGRAVVNFRGPIVFCVVSRYHGGAFVVFSKALNPGLEAAALEGSYASVIGGAPAAAVVFARDVETRTRTDARVKALDAEIAAAAPDDRTRLRARLAELVAAVRAEKLGAVAAEFDRVHSVQRALRTGSLDRIIPAAALRPYLVDALRRGMEAAA